MSKANGGNAGGQRPSKLVFNDLLSDDESKWEADVCVCVYGGEVSVTSPDLITPTCYCVQVILFCFTAF